MEIRIRPEGEVPIYRQIVAEITKEIKEKSLSGGELLPSLNELAAGCRISRETVKKAYGILCKEGLIESRHGKGFFVKRPNESGRKRVLMIFDRFSVYKQVIYNSFVQTMGGSADTTILTHDQDPELLKFLLDRYLYLFDYYLISPHFPLDQATQEKVLGQLKRIPSRRCILFDYLPKGLPSGYGAVYQDFEEDTYDGLMQGRDKLRHASRLCVVTLPTSLYGSVVQESIVRAAHQLGIPAEFFSQTPESCRRGDCFLLLNSQLDWGLSDLCNKIEDAHLRIGQDVWILSYNEFPFADLVLGGLSTLSTDFARMGSIMAEMILSGKLSKVHCPFHLTSRTTF